MIQYPVSVILCTVERGNFLHYVMQGVAKLRPSVSEFIVVVGPCQDGTNSILCEYKKYIDQIIYTAFKNVSIARNLGLKAASQEIVLYLDDDVIPSQDWIQHHVEAHQRGGKRYGCVAGIVVDYQRPTTPVQFARGVSSCWSENYPVLSPQLQKRYLSRPEWFPGVMGANASYQREALLEIGGFDEFFEYFLEETDVGLRLLKGGYEITYIDVAVAHYVQPSHNRYDRIHLTCWYALAKNTTYFALKHRLPDYPVLLFWLRLGGVLVYRCGLRILRLKWTHGVSNGVLLGYLWESWCGFKVGVQAGLELES